VAAFFRATTENGHERLLPEPCAASNWTHAGTMMRGMAVSAALARAAERAVDRRDLRPVRWTVDLSRPVAMDSLDIRSSLLRTGRRVALVQVDVFQGHGLAASARGLFLKPGEATTGRRWHSDHQPSAPPEASRLETGSRLYFSGPGGWTTNADVHHNDAPKQLWQSVQPTVQGEDPTPFQVAATAADLASVVTHWGTTGLTFVNADISLSLVRQPHGSEVGIAAHDRWEADGIAVGTALLHDREGFFGISTVSGLGNARHLVDPAARDR